MLIIIIIYINTIMIVLIHTMYYVLVIKCENTYDI